MHSIRTAPEKAFIDVNSFRYISESSTSFKITILNYSGSPIGYDVILHCRSRTFQISYIEKDSKRYLFPDWYEEKKISDMWAMEQCLPLVCTEDGGTREVSDILEEYNKRYPDKKRSWELLPRR